MVRPLVGELEGDYSDVVLGPEPAGGAQAPPVPREVVRVPLNEEGWEIEAP